MKKAILKLSEIYRMAKEFIIKDWHRSILIDNAISQEKAKHLASYAMLGMNRRDF